MPPAEQFQAGQGWQQFPAFPAQPTWQQPPAQQPEAPQPQKRGSSPLLIAILVVLILILVGGAGLTYYLLAGRSSQNPNTARTTTPTTAASTPGITPSPTFNTNDPQSLYNQVTATTPAFSEPLTTLNAGDWSGPDPAQCSFTSQGLRLNVPSNASSVLCTASASNYNDFAYQVQLKVARGQGGLVFRGNSAGVYLLEIDAQQQVFGLVSIAGGNSTANGKILMSSQSSSINVTPNQTNLLAIIARGNKLYVYINKQFVNSVTDNTSSAGAIGVVCFRDTDITFSNAQVWTF